MRHSLSGTGQAAAAARRSAAVRGGALSPVAAPPADLEVRLWRQSIETCCALYTAGRQWLAVFELRHSFVTTAKIPRDREIPVRNAG